ncbi:MAG: ABC transporter substrate-binding protein [Beijerinckiaceae bacterium]|nr:ABC transporter substrate-binding protein [Beijerinckiaceae bacterium]
MSIASAITLSRRAFARTALCGAALVAVMSSGALAQQPSWLDPTLLAAAKKEGKVVFYSSINEQEGLPLLKIFEEATGVTVEYVRNSDSGLLSRILVEARAGKQSWDVIQTTAVNKMQQELLAKFDVPEAKALPAEAKDPDGRWYGIYANYNAPAYNTNKIKREDLPKTLEEFAQKKEWAGRVAIDYSDNEWLAAVYQHYGEAKGRKLVQDIITNLKPVVVKGHLALARSVGAGEYDVALNNYLNLTINVMMTNGPTNYWLVDPVAVFYGQVGVNAKAPSPNAARLLANFFMSVEGQTALTSKGRFPTRPGIETNPPGIMAELAKFKVVAATLSPSDEAKWQKDFKTLFNIR